MLEVRAIDVFYGDAQALHEVSLHVGDGEIVCMVGSNGAGKSTLVNAVMGMRRIRNGSVVMDGEDVAAVPPHHVCRAGIAVVPEGRRIFPDMSVGDNMALGAYRAGARTERTTTRQQVLELFPRLAERLQQRAGNLSGGEQQMLAIGRALMTRPRMLLMDEPSLGLAPVVVDEVFDVIEVINRSGVAVLIVEQNVQRALDIADRGYLISEGRIALEGTAAELAADGEVRRAVLGL